MSLYSDSLEGPVVLFPGLRHRPDFDHSQYAKTKREGLEDLQCSLVHGSLVTSRKNLRKIRLVTQGKAFLLATELFERANQIVACPITRAAHWRTSACADANW